MSYAWVKIIHVISASILLGCGVGLGIYWLAVNRQFKLSLIALAAKQVFLLNITLLGLSSLIQLITGIFLMGLKPYSPLAFWFLISMSSYVVAGISWVAMLYFQMRCEMLANTAIKNNTSLPEQYSYSYRMTCVLGLLAFLSLLVVFYFMANR